MDDYPENPSNTILAILKSLEQSQARTTPVWARRHLSSYDGGLDDEKKQLLVKIQDNLHHALMDDKQKDAAVRTIADIAEYDVYVAYYLVLDLLKTTRSRLHLLTAIAADLVGMMPQNEQDAAILRIQQVNYRIRSLSIVDRFIDK